MESSYRILWADDEIELLKPHVLFLEAKGYAVTAVNSGVEAVEEVEVGGYDIVFLDESMPGMSGLEALAKIKEMNPNLPVVMITKNEEESIMEEAIGAKISDYLIKPINPKQILLAIKKILDNRRIVSEKTNMAYQQDFQKLSMTYNDIIDYEGWIEVYKKLVYWEREIDNTEAKSMKQVLEMQKQEANTNFTRFIKDNYQGWLDDEFDKPMQSHELFAERVFPLLEEENEPVFFILIDNLRYDQWKTLEPLISPYFRVNEEAYFSILPTTTAYARNSIFSGRLPSTMAKFDADIWAGEEEEGGKNQHEDEFLRRQIQRNKLDVSFSYHKIFSHDQGRKVVDNFNQLKQNDLNVLVYNFVDMLSHARTDIKVIKELASDESAYRSLTKSWFEHSSLLELLKRIRETNSKVVLTTDHGTIRVQKPVKIKGDKNTNSNLRYKQGKSLSYDDKNVFVAKKPEDFYLPKSNVSTSYVFATHTDFFAYPNNFNYYVGYYKDTFQHGGVSLEEMIIPLITLTPK
ncbi:MAG: bifunctional response regulator/alkaline phosphatase family protein [Cytophagales bacterium]|nr:bifunctional response regulator/alkaline phosphatase family protein [Cytophagales bacterium]